MASTVPYNLLKTRKQLISVAVLEYGILRANNRSNGGTTWFFRFMPDGIELLRAGMLARPVMGFPIRQAFWRTVAIMRGNRGGKSIPRVPVSSPPKTAQETPVRVFLERDRRGLETSSPAIAPESSLGPASKWVHDADGTIPPIVLKVFGQEFRQAIVLRVRP